MIAIQSVGRHVPDFGAIFASMIVEDGDQIPMSDLINPRIEAEVSFVMAEDLQGPRVSAFALRAVAGAVVSIEVIDTRVADWKINFKGFSSAMRSSSMSATSLCGSA